MLQNFLHPTSDNAAMLVLYTTVCKTCSKFILATINTQAQRASRLETLWGKAEVEDEVKDLVVKSSIETDALNSCMHILISRQKLQQTRGVLSRIQW